MKKLLAFLVFIPLVALAVYNPNPQATVVSPTDAFQRMSVAHPYTIFDSVFTYSSRSLLYEFQTNATATITHLPNDSSIRLDCWSSNTLEWVQSKQWFRYIPGKGELLLMTVVLPHSSTNAGMIQRFGQYSDQNGYYFTRSNGVMGVALRSYTSGSVVDTIVNQSDWNIDKMDGLGISKHTLQPTNGNIYIIQYQWLGYGKVTFAIDYDGKVLPVHSFDHQGGSHPYMTSATLPVRWGLENKASGVSTNTMTATCVSLISNGADVEDYERGFVFAAGNDADVSTSATPGVLTAIRPAILFNSITNRSTIVPLMYNIQAGANSQYEIQYGATLTGGSWFQPNPDSAIEVNTNATLSVAGRVLEKGYIAAGAGSTRGGTTSEIIGRLPIVLDNYGTNQTLGVSIIVRTLTGTSTARGAIQWRELR